MAWQCKNDLRLLSCPPATARKQCTIEIANKLIDVVIYRYIMKSIARPLITELAMMDLSHRDLFLSDLLDEYKRFTNIKDLLLNLSIRYSDESRLKNRTELVEENQTTQLALYIPKTEEIISPRHETFYNLIKDERNPKLFSETHTDSGYPRRTCSIFGDNNNETKLNEKDRSKIFVNYFDAPSILKKPIESVVKETPKFDYDSPLKGFVEENLVISSNTSQDNSNSKVSIHRDSNVECEEKALLSQLIVGLAANKQLLHPNQDHSSKSLLSDKSNSMSVSVNHKTDLEKEKGETNFTNISSMKPAEEKSPICESQKLLNIKHQHETQMVKENDNSLYVEGFHNSTNLSCRSPLVTSNKNSSLNVIEVDLDLPEQIGFERVEKIGNENDENAMSIQVSKELRLREEEEKDEDVPGVRKRKGAVYKCRLKNESLKLCEILFNTTDLSEESDNLSTTVGFQMPNTSSEFQNLDSPWKLNLYRDSIVPSDSSRKDITFVTENNEQNLEEKITDVSNTISRRKIWKENSEKNPNKYKYDFQEESSLFRKASSLLESLHVTLEENKHPGRLKEESIKSRSSGGNISRNSQAIDDVQQVTYEIIIKNTVRLVLENFYRNVVKEKETQFLNVHRKSLETGSIIIQEEEDHLYSLIMNEIKNHVYKIEKNLEKDSSNFYSIQNEKIFKEKFTKRTSPNLKKICHREEQKPNGFLVEIKSNSIGIEVEQGLKRSSSFEQSPEIKVIDIVLETVQRLFKTESRNLLSLIEEEIKKQRKFRYEVVKGIYFREMDHLFWVAEEFLIKEIEGKVEFVAGFITKILQEISDKEILNFVKESCVKVTKLLYSSEVIQQLKSFSEEKSNKSSSKSINCFHMDASLHSNNETHERQLHQILKIIEFNVILKELEFALVGILSEHQSLEKGTHGKYVGNLQVTGQNELEKCFQIKDSLTKKKEEPIKPELNNTAISNRFHKLFQNEDGHLEEEFIRKSSGCALHDHSETELVKNETKTLLKDGYDNNQIEANVIPKKMFQKSKEVNCFSFETVENILIQEKYNIYSNKKESLTNDDTSIIQKDIKNEMSKENLSKKDFIEKESKLTQEEFLVESSYQKILKNESEFITFSKEIEVNVEISKLKIDKIKNSFERKSLLNGFYEKEGLERLNENELIHVFAFAETKMLDEIYKKVGEDSNQITREVLTTDLEEKILDRVSENINNIITNLLEEAISRLELEKDQINKEMSVKNEIEIKIPDDKNEIPKTKDFESKNSIYMLKVLPCDERENDKKTTKSSDYLKKLYFTKLVNKNSTKRCLMENIPNKISEEEMIKDKNSLEYEAKDSKNDHKITNNQNICLRERIFHPSYILRLSDNQFFENSNTIAFTLHSNGKQSFFMIRFGDSLTSEIVKNQLRQIQSIGLESNKNLDLRFPKKTLLKFCGFLKVSPEKLYLRFPENPNENERFHGNRNGVSYLEDDHRTDYAWEAKEKERTKLDNLSKTPPSQFCYFTISVVWCLSGVICVFSFVYTIYLLVEQANLQEHWI